MIDGKPVETVPSWRFFEGEGARNRSSPKKGICIFAPKRKNERARNDGWLTGRRYFTDSVWS